MYKIVYGIDGIRSSSKITSVCRVCGNRSTASAIVGTNGIPVNLLEQGLAKLKSWKEAWHRILKNYDYTISKIILM